MSKETAIIMPALAGLVWIFASKKDILTGIWQKTAELIKILGLFLIVAAVYIFLRATILNFGSTFNLYGTNANLFSSNVGVRIITFFRIFTDYLGLLFWPARLHMERSVEWAASFAHLDVIFGVALFIAVLSLAIWKLRKKSPLSFGLLWFLIGLSPTSNIAVPINGLLYEHWLYLPLAGFALAFGDAFWSLLQKVGKRNWIYFAAGGMVFIITAAMAARSIARNFDWRDPVVFYTQTLAFAPNDYKLLNNLGMEYAGRQDLVNAAKYYNLAINIQPDVAVAYYNLGNLLLAQNQEQKALEKYVRALEVDPKFLYAYPPVIEIYSQEGNKEMAQKYYQQYSGIIRGK
jgi:tetratricopeptide (TPR) repeat protein